MVGVAVYHVGSLQIGSLIRAEVCSRISLLVESVLGIVIAFAIVPEWVDVVGKIFGTSPLPLQRTRLLQSYKSVPLADR